MAYTKINMELVVFAEDTEAIVAELNAALDGMEAGHTIFGGGIETVAVEHRTARKRSALRHTLAAGDTAVAAMKMAGGKIAGTLREII
jgi:hypothetical protein